MLNAIAILIPTRERPADLRLFLESWVKTTTGFSSVFIGIDKDDPTDYSFINDVVPENLSHCVNIQKYDRKPFLHLLNEMAQFCMVKDFKYVGFMEDDCCFESSWEQEFISQLEILQSSHGYGIVWGNDKINENRLVGLPFMTRNIIDVLGYMSPPEIECLWADYFWKLIGEKMNCLHYFPEITIEHRHYSTGKRPKCKISELVDNTGHRDYYSYQRYMQRHEEDIKKLNENKFI